MAQVIVQRPTKNKGKNTNTQQGNNSWQIAQLDLLNDANDDGKEKIYTDFNFDLEAESESPSSEDPPVKQGPWGVYAVKPLRQNQWESAVKNEIDKMVEQRLNQKLQQLDAVMD